MIARLILVAAVAILSSRIEVQISVKARALQPGELIVVSVAGADASAPLHVRAFGHDVAAYRVGDEWKALVGIDLDVKPGTYPIVVEPGGHSYDLTVRPKVFRTRRLSVDEDFVTPPASEQPRIEREAALLASTWRGSVPSRQWTSSFIRPVPQDANSAFGTRSIFNGKPRHHVGSAACR